MNDADFSENYIECEVCGCFNSANEDFTRCCHVRLCDDHNKMYAACCISKCENSFTEYCKICLEINSYVCNTCGLTLCDDCNIEENTCEC